MGFSRSALILITAALALGGEARAAPRVGQPAPDFQVTTFGGRTLRLADLKGDVILLNFWATWCGPCKRELPMLETAFRAYGQYGFQVLAVATEDSVPENQLRPLASKLTIPFVKRLKGPYHQMEGVPTNYIIDRSGKLVYAQAAAFDLDSLNAIVIPLLKEPIPDPASAAPAAAPGGSGSGPATTKATAATAGTAGVPKPGDGIRTASINLSRASRMAGIPAASPSLAP